MRWSVVVLVACGHSDPVTIDAPVLHPVDAHVADAHVIPDAPPPCNMIANVGTVVTVQCSTATPPTMTGGVIPDGTYVFSAATVSQTTCTGALGTGGPTTLAIAGGVEQSIDVQGGAKTYAQTTDGQHTMTVTQTCPTAGHAFTSQYTVTTGGYQELQGASVLLEWTRVGP